MNSEISAYLPTLIVHFEGFLLTQKCVALNTYLAYKRDINRFQKFISAQYKSDHIEHVHKESIIAYLEFLQEKNYSARSSARTIAALRLFFKYIQEQYKITIFCDFILPKASHKLPVFCTEQEIEQIIQASMLDTSVYGIRNRLIILMLYCTGLRVSELVCVRKSDIHYDTAQLHIRGKGGKTRIIPLIDLLLQEIKRYISSTMPQPSAKNPVNDYLFPGVQKNHLSRQAVWRIIKDLIRQTTLTKKISPHTFRHSLATHNLKNGWDLRSLQLLLGHENISTVEIYTHVETSHLRKMYNKKHPRS